MCDAVSYKDAFFTVTAASMDGTMLEMGNAGTTLAVVSVYSGDCSALSYLTCVPLLPNSSTAVTGLTSGQVYIIRVNGYNGTNLGNFEFGVFDASAPLIIPPNDDAVDAINVMVQNSCGTYFTANNIGATESAEEPVTCNVGVDGVERDIWYTFVAPPSGKVSVRRNTTDWSAITGSIMTGTPGSLTSLHCDIVHISVGLDMTGLTAGTTYYLRLWATTNETAGDAEICIYDPDQTVVPVTLLHFQALVEDRSIHLTWATASEQNNEGFAVERSNDFTRTFETIGWHAGAGTSSQPVSYSFLDSAELPAGNYYYRLKQVDFDGTCAYAGVQHVSLAVQSEQEIILYPNPVRDNLHIRSSGPCLVEMYTLTGTLVQRYALSGEETVPMQDLAAGTYLVWITDVSGRSLVRRVVRR